jgi:hypothetical protein
MKNEVMRSIYVCIISAIEVVLFFKLGGNEVKKISRCPPEQVAVFVLRRVGKNGQKRKKKRRDTKKEKMNEYS